MISKCNYNLMNWGSWTQLTFTNRKHKAQTVDNLSPPIYLSISYIYLYHILACWRPWLACMGVVALCEVQTEVLLSFNEHIFLFNLIFGFALFCTCYSIAHFTLYFSFFLFLLCCVTFIYVLFVFFCTVHWADLIWSTFHFWLYPV